MKKGNIKIPISEIWELINKPHRFFEALSKEVEKLPEGKYDLLVFDKETKKELLDRIEEIYYTGELVHNDID
jgi:hypothetical protein